MDEIISTIGTHPNGCLVRNIDERFNSISKGYEWILIFPSEQDDGAEQSLDETNETNDAK